MTEKSPVKEGETRSHPSTSTHTHTASLTVIDCKEASKRARMPDTDSCKIDAKRAKKDKHKSRQKLPAAKGSSDSEASSSDS